VKADQAGRSYQKGEKEPRRATEHVSNPDAAKKRRAGHAATRWQRHGEWCRLLQTGPICAAIDMKEKHVFLRRPKGHKPYHLRP